MNSPLSEAVLQPSTSTTQGLRLRRLILVLRPKIKTRNFSRRRPTSSATRLLLWTGGSLHLQLLYYDDDNGSCRRSLSGLLYEARFFLALHCSSTVTAAYPIRKFITAPCSSTRGLLRPPAWLRASEYREAPGPPGGCVGFIGPLPFPHPPQ